MKHDEKARQMRREEARRLWGQNESRSQNPRAAIGRARPLSQSQRNCNVKSGKLIRRPQGYQKGCVTLNKYEDTADEHML